MAFRVSRSAGTVVFHSLSRAAKCLILVIALERDVAELERINDPGQRFQADRRVVSTPGDRADSPRVGQSRQRGQADGLKSGGLRNVGQIPWLLQTGQSRFCDRFVCGLQGQVSQANCRRGTNILVLITVCDRGQGLDVTQPPDGHAANPRVGILSSDRAQKVLRFVG